MSLQIQVVHPFQALGVNYYEGEVLISKTEEETALYSKFCTFGWAKDTSGSIPTGIIPTAPVTINPAPTTQHLGDEQ